MKMICLKPGATSLISMLALLIPPVTRAQEQQSLDVLTRLKSEPWVPSLAYKARIAGKVPEAKAILLERLRQNSCDHPDPDSGVDCGGMALSLQALDPDSREGEKYLVQPVEAFLSERVPAAFRSAADAQNKTLTPEYKAWIEARQWSLTEAMKWETMYGLLLLSAASIGDSQLNPLFRRGLESNAFGIVIASVRGLALLRDKTALPRILAALERLKQVYGLGADVMILLELWNYDDPQVDRLVETKLPEEFRGLPIDFPRLKSDPALRPQP